MRGRGREGRIRVREVERREVHIYTGNIKGSEECSY